MIMDFAKFDRPAMLHVGFQGLSAFKAEHGRDPRPGNKEDGDAFVSIVKKINEESIKVCGQGCDQPVRAGYSNMRVVGRLERGYCPRLGIASHRGCGSSRRCHWRHCCARGHEGTAPSRSLTPWRVVDLAGDCRHAVASSPLSSSTCTLMRWRPCRKLAPQRTQMSSPLATATTGWLPCLGTAL